MSIMDLVKQLIKRKLENGISVSIELPSWYTAPEERTKCKSKKKQ